MLEELRVKVIREVCTCTDVDLLDLVQKLIAYEDKEEEEERV